MLKYMTRDNMEYLTKIQAQGRINIPKLVLQTMKMSKGDTVRIRIDKANEGD